MRINRKARAAAREADRRWHRARAVEEAERDAPRQAEKAKWEAGADARWLAEKRRQAEWAAEAPARDARNAARDAAGAPARAAVWAARDAAQVVAHAADVASGEWAKREAETAKWERNLEAAKLSRRERNARGIPKHVHHYSNSSIMGGSPLQRRMSCDCGRMASPFDKIE